MRKFWVKRLSSGLCLAPSICQSSKACITQVLPVPVAIFTAYFGIWYFCLPSMSRSSEGIRSGVTLS